MKIRFQADADLNQIILLATVRRELSIDFQTAGVAGLASRTDREVLDIAARDGRLLVTHDQKTMPPTFRGVHCDSNEPWVASDTAAPFNRYRGGRSTVDLVAHRGGGMD